jgi:nucleolar complex protein 3
VAVFRGDLTGQPSLEIVRLLNRMIKERRFRVHPNVLSCLLSLRLKTELAGIRASEVHANKDDDGTQRAKKRTDRVKDRPHLSKKAKKAYKENKEIQKEMHEAEAEVDKEERAKTVRLYSGPPLVGLAILSSSTAHGNAQIALRAVLPHIKTHSPDAVITASS